MARTRAAPERGIHLGHSCVGTKSTSRRCSSATRFQAAIETTLVRLVTHFAPGFPPLRAQSDLRAVEALVLGERVAARDALGVLALSISSERADPVFPGLCVLAEEL